jgi:hypothetical protein
MLLERSTPACVRSECDSEIQASLVPTEKPSGSAGAGDAAAWDELVWSPGSAAQIRWEVKLSRSI